MGTLGGLGHHAETGDRKYQVSGHDILSKPPTSDQFEWVVAFGPLDEGSGTPTVGTR